MNPFAPKPAHALIEDHVALIDLVSYGMKKYQREEIEKHPAIVALRESFGTYWQDNHVLDHHANFTIGMVRVLVAESLGFLQYVDKPAVVIPATPVHTTDES